MKKLIILTLEYPFGKGEIFLSAELNFYSRQKIEVVLVPLKSEGQPRVLPEGISLYEGKTGWNGWINALKELITMRWVWKEFIKFFFYFFVHSSRISILFFLKTSIILKNRLLHLNTSNQIDKSSIIYSYWLGGLTGGAILFNQLAANSFKIVSRAHGGDLYEYRYKPSYIPFRELVLRNVDLVTVVSKNGMEYLKLRFPEFSEKIRYFYLGTPEQGFQCSPSVDKIFRIVSCSYVSPVKRINLIVEALKVFQDHHPEIEIHWTHIGGGDGLDYLKNTSAKLDKSVACRFVGDWTQHQIMEFYRNNPVDVLVNTSISEGMPVSMMEALSVGVPVLATDVGGVGEIIDDSCGKLMPKDISATQLAQEFYLWYGQSHAVKRSMAREKWGAFFNDEKNFKSFYEAIDQRSANT